MFKNIVLPALLFCALPLVLYYPVALNVRSSIGGPPDDAYAILWHLWWFKESLTHNLSTPFFTGFVESPYGVALTNMTIVNHLLALPLTCAFGPVASYNLMILLSFVAASFGMYLLAIEVTGSPAAAFFAGLVYSFSPYHTVFSASGGMDAAQIQYIPFTILFVMRYGRSSSARDLALFMVFLVLTVLSFGYYAATIALIILVYLLTVYAAPSLGMDRKGAFSFAALSYGLLVFFANSFEEALLPVKAILLLSAPVAAVSFLSRPGTRLMDHAAQGLKKLDRRTFLLISTGSVFLVGAVIAFLVPVFGAASRPISDSYIVPLWSLVVPPPDHPVLGPLVPGSLAPFPDPFSGKMVYLGLTVPALAVYGALSGTSPIGESLHRRFLMVLFVLGVLLLLPPVVGIGGLKLYGPVYFFHKVVVPFVDVRRAIVIVLVPASILAGAGLTAIVSREGVPRNLLYLSVLAITAVEFYPTPVFSDISKVPSAYGWLASIKGDFTVAEYPLTSIYDSRRYEPFYGQTIHGKRLINPFAAMGHDPNPDNPLLRSFLERSGPANDILANPDNAATALKSLGVRYVVLRTDKTGALPTGLDLGSSFKAAARFDDSTVYEVTPGPSTAVAYFHDFLRSGYFANYLEISGDRHVVRNPYIRPPFASEGGVPMLWMGKKASMRILPLRPEIAAYDLRFKARSYEGDALLTVKVKGEKVAELPITPVVREFALTGLQLDTSKEGLRVDLELPVEMRLKKIEWKEGPSKAEAYPGAAIGGVILKRSDAGSAVIETPVKRKALDGLYF